jgi:hypothetical protein
MRGSPNKDISLYFGQLSPARDPLGGYSPRWRAGAGRAGGSDGPAAGRALEEIMGGAGEADTAHFGPTEVY